MGDWITEGYLADLERLKRQWREQAAKQASLEKSRVQNLWCHVCQAERKFSATEAAWECTDCGTEAYWRDIEKLKEVWRNAETEDWHLEDDAGMGSWREELREFRLSVELEWAQQARERLENELHRYRTFISVAREMITPLKE